MQPINNEKIVLRCEQCFQKLRVPVMRKMLVVTCPSCCHSFSYRYYAFGFSSQNHRQLGVGIVGSLVGWIFLEGLNTTRWLAGSDPYLQSILSIASFAGAYGAIMAASVGFFAKDRQRLISGMAIGAILGVVAGAIAGLVAQFVYSTILSERVTDGITFWDIVARTVGWSALGAMLGAAFGIKENTHGDLKYGLIGGALGGAVGGLLFDPIGIFLYYGNGTFGRLAGFVLLGAAIALTVERFRSAAVALDKPEMSRRLTRLLPNNPRLSGPSK